MGFKAEEIKKLISSEVSEIGKEVLVFDEVESTNSIGYELLRQDYPSGTVVIADKQTKGRGRLGRRWISPGGKNLYLSFAIKPQIHPKYATLLTLTAGIACTTALRRYTEIPVIIKWPNDMLVGDKKVGGILTEMKIDGEKIKAAVIGIGININMTEEDIPEEIREIATSLRIFSNEEYSRTELAAEVIKELDKWYQLLSKKNSKAIIDRWIELNGTIGKQVRVVLSDREIIGLAEAIDEEGSLIVKLEDGTREKICAGEVALLRTK